ncbi:response regulator [Candidatus Magnetobacterium casense]|uniref:histidine kinase n=1 Tax=Candidatus Magnetobacterium casense TaxID=1455061 RepID=A0ABS6RTP1_9BACT|nr:response regulator [Candidatus Magnetobacterium casensis]MBV6339994.1 response regulator [Candidatus Magnetobacterium casensis]
MMLKNTSIGLRLAMAFSLLFVLFAFVAIFAVNRLDFVLNQTRLMYNHPFTVSNAVLRIDGNTTKIRLIMRKAAYTTDKDEILRYKGQVAEYIAQIDKDFDLLEERFLGEKHLVNDAQTNFKQWEPLIAHLFSLAMDGKIDDAKALINSDKYTSNTMDMETTIKMVYDYAQNKAITFRDNAHDTGDDFKNQIYILIAIIFALGMAVTFVFTRGITRPIRELISATDEIGQGRLDTAIDVTSTDEIGQLAGSFRNMTAKLKTTLTDMDKENWKKTGISQLNDKMRGEQDVMLLAQNIIGLLTKYLDAQVGAIYLVEGDKKLRLTASYAYTKRKGLSNTFVFGEGLVGQAALEGQCILITDAPEDYIKITSGLGESRPVNILVVPFLYERQVMGVIEIGSLGRFDDTRVELVEMVSQSVGIAFSVAQAREKMTELLSTTQAQAEELQVQQEELRASNEALSEQTKTLRDSEAELQAQQEELRQVNEELEERAKILQQQRDEIKQKNTELERAQQITTEKAQELEVTSKYKSEFLANMSHELRTPLNSILLLSKHLADNKDGNLSSKQLECAQTVYSSGNDLLALINDILDLSKVEAGKMELHVEPLDFSELATSIGRTFVPVAQNKGLTLDVVVAQDIRASIRTDAQKLEQILRNLISNAIKFTEKGGVTVNIGRCTDASVTLGSGTEEVVAISVSDTGIGIAPDKQGVIFEAFKQADGTTSRKYGGTGLGLTISRELTRLLGGQLHLKSVEHNGSTFTLYLPQSLESQGYPQPQTRQPSKADSTPVEPMPRTAVEFRPPAGTHTGADILEDDRQHLSPGDKSILVIEDDPVFAKILYDISHEKGFKCIIAGDGRRGCEYAETYRPDAIILDVGLPVMDGRMVLERLKDSAGTRNIPVHIVSAADKSIDCLKSGVVGYLTKPVSMERLDDVFKTLEGIFAQGSKRLLAVNLDTTQRATVLELLDNAGVETVFVSPVDVPTTLKTKGVNCIVLNLGVDEAAGFALLDTLKAGEQFSEVPVIVYNSAVLSKEAETKLNMYCHRLIVKRVISNERLLDEIVLFLHLIESKLPPEKQRMIDMVHDKDTIFKDKTILIVDDDVRNVFALSSVLQERDVNVLVGRDGREGIARLKDNKAVELVLMDIMMPEMDGYEAIRQIRSIYEYRNLPIIALTAKAMKEDKMKCIEAGANDYLAKPIDADRLLSLLRVWLYK